MTKTKKIFIALLSGLLVLCACFAVLLSRPAAQANAEENELPRLSLDYLFEENECYGTATLSETETYSETWVINEKWVGIAGGEKTFDIGIKWMNADYTSFLIFYDGYIAVKKNSQETRLCSRVNGEYYYVDGNGNYIAYSEWTKEGRNVVSFTSDTSATEYAELRTWLTANAVKQEAETPVETITLTIKDGYSGEILGTETINKGSVISNEIAEKYKTIANNRANGRTIDGWKINGTFQGFPYPYEITQDTVIEVMYFACVNFINNGEKIYHISGSISTLGGAADYGSGIAVNLPITADENFLGWTNVEGSSTILSNDYNIEYGGVYNFYAVFKTPTYTLTFMNGEDVLGTVEATGGDKLSALELPFFLPVVAGKDFKGWSYEENGDVLDLEAETVTEAKTLYAVYEDVVPDTPDNPDNPENPDKSFEDKVKDFGNKASEWLEQNVGLSISGGAVIVILIAAAILIFSKRR